MCKIILVAQDFLHMTETRIIELEIKSAYQDDLLQALNQVVSAQTLQIQRLEATCQLLNTKIESLQNQANVLPESEQLPPHY